MKKMEKQNMEKNNERFDTFQMSSEAFFAKSLCYC